MVGAGIAGPVDEVAPIRDCILGTDISGTGRTVGQTTVSLFPDADEAVFDIILLAVNNSQSVGRNGPVCVYTTGRTGIGVCKRVWMDADGLSAHPAAANAETHTTISDICAVNGSQLIERIAWRRAGKQQGGGGEHRLATCPLHGRRARGSTGRRDAARRRTTTTGRSSAGPLERAVGLSASAAFQHHHATSSTSSAWKRRPINWRRRAGRRP